MPPGSEGIEIEVIYALPEEQPLVRLRVDADTTLLDAIRLSGLLDRYPEIDLNVNRIGVFGQLRTLTDMVHAGDRVEIYRSLHADPKEARRRRARIAGKE